MALTKKHLDALADALNLTGLATQPTPDAQHLRDVSAVADVCARFNHGFDRARFLTACGVDEPAPNSAEKWECESCGLVWRRVYPLGEVKTPELSCPECDSDNITAAKEG